MTEKHKHPEYELAAQLLELASDEFGNHICNDFTLPNTPENFELIEAMERWNVSLSGEMPTPVHVSKDGKEIYTNDWYLMSYLAYLLKKAAE